MNALRRFEMLWTCERDRCFRWAVNIVVLVLVFYAAYCAAEYLLGQIP